jgi:hypothetical protein
VAERSNAAVLKTVEPQGSGGSNPSSSAIKTQPSTKSGAFCWWPIECLACLSAKERHEAFVMADRGKEGMLMYERNGLRFSLLDSKGIKVGVPIKASALYSNPTMKTLQNVFERNSLLKESQKERLTKIIDSFFHATDKHTRASFCGYMKLYEINAMFREGKDGSV